ncbi:MAG: hypothetical protein LCI02_15235 [Proteobacteria bacterium]|nr:hypothetical protein [Pseudomonadota bacterium]
MSRRPFLALLPLAVAAASLLAPPPLAFAQQPAPADTAGAAVALPADPELATALQRFAQAGPDNHAAIEDAAARFDKLSAAHPADPVLRAYAGAATAMLASTTWQPWRKLSLAEDGLSLIDKALAQLGPAHDAPLHRGVPAALETRFIAAGTFLALPSMFKRRDRGRQLLQDVMASPLFDGAPAPFKAVVQQRAARLAEADRKAGA